ncbi:MAG: RNA methyltransferase [Clostridium sp.]|nr:RNA methyltransferase [Clostridiaceae bacterium]MDY5484890.1 RNA methyltransferase [Clostridium sp.]
MITSTGNARIKAVSALAKKAKLRREQKLFLVEGPKMFAELPKERLREAYVSESFLSQQGERAERLLSGCRYETVSDDVMRYMSDTQTPQGILAVAEQFSYELSDLLETNGAVPHLMLLETLQDPGNLGTILRAGEGAGITGVVMNEATADIYNPKVIRSTMGSIYRVPFVYVKDWKEAITEIKRQGIRLYAAHLKGTTNYEDQDYSGPVGFLIGNEANGLTDETAALADCYVRIPMAGRVESLNAAVAASILMFETARQRRKNSLFFH